VHVVVSRSGSLKLAKESIVASGAGQKASLTSTLLAALPQTAAPSNRPPAAIVRRLARARRAFAKWARLGLEIGKNGGEANANDARDACRDLC
jgi:hypothetical protein